MRSLFVTLALALTISFTLPAAAFDIQGGGVWERRTGPGVMLALGGVDCTDDYCDDGLDTSFFGSFDATLGFVYRVMPNLEIFVDVDTAYINTDWGNLDDDGGFLFQLIAGAAFHLPITGWVSPYFGLGIGYVFLGAWGEGDYNGGGIFGGDDIDVYNGLHGFDFELRMGADVFPAAHLPLSVGPIVRIGMPLWIEACYEYGDADDCDDADDVIDDDDLPFLVHVGLAGKYSF